METLLDLLDNTDKRVLFITGAGISVNSGIPPYRGSSDAVWSNFVQDFATRKKFLMYSQYLTVHSQNHDQKKVSNK